MNVLPRSSQMRTKPLPHIELYFSHVHPNSPASVYNYRPAKARMMQAVRKKPKKEELKLQRPRHLQRQIRILPQALQHPSNHSHRQKTQKIQHSVIQKAFLAQPLQSLLPLVTTKQHPLLLAIPRLAPLRPRTRLCWAPQFLRVRTHRWMIFRRPFCTDQRLCLSFSRQGVLMSPLLSSGHRSDDGLCHPRK